MVLTEAPGQAWAWWHQLVATFFSVAFASTVAVWLYSWQTGKANSDRITELRAAQLIGIYDMWNRLDDENLQRVKLPDGSIAWVLLTFLQPTIYEESIKTGLFGTAETMVLSRLSAIIHLYNASAQSLLPVLRAIVGADGSAPDPQRVEELRSEIDTVLSNREKVVEASKGLVNLWTLKEVRKALAVADPNAREDRDPRVATVLEEHLPQISPPSYKAGIHDKLDKANEAFRTGDRDAASLSLDEAIKEAEELRESTVTPDKADDMIVSLTDLKKTMQEHWGTEDSETAAPRE